MSLGVDLTDSGLGSGEVAIPGGTRSRAQSSLALVAQLAGHAGGSADIHEILAEVARAARLLTGLPRISLFMLDGECLKPALSSSHVADEELFASFRSMPPVSLDIGVAGDLLAQPKAVQIDARTSPLVPAEWRSLFGLTDLAVVPLIAGSKLYGVLIGDGAGEDASPLALHQLDALSTVASLAGLLLERAQGADAAAHQAKVVLGLVRALGDMADPRKVLEATGQALRDLADAGAVTLTVESLPPKVQIVIGTAQAATQVPEHEDAPVRSTLTEPGAAFESDRWVLVTGEPVLTAVLSGLRTTPDAGTRRSVRLALDVCGKALDHAVAAGQIQGRREQLAGTAAALRVCASPPNWPLLAERLADPFRQATGGMELVDLVVRPAARARALGLRPLLAAESRRLVSLAADQAWRSVRGEDGPVYCPLVSGGALLGALVVRVGEGDVRALAVITDALAPAVEAAILRSEVASAHAKLEAQQARSAFEASARLASLSSLRRLDQLVAAASESVSRNGMRQRLDVVAARDIIRWAMTDLGAADQLAAAVSSSKATFLTRLRALARTSSRHGFDVAVRAEAGSSSSRPESAATLLLCVSEVIGVAAAARATMVVLRLSREGGATVILDVQANGRLALADGQSGRTSSHFKLRAIQRRLEASGTRVDVRNTGTTFGVRFVCRTTPSPVGSMGAPSARA